MIAKWLTDNLGTVANTPQSVEKLRALFLRLALTGKLQLQGALNTDAAGWSNVRLDQVATITMGNSPPGESYNERGDGVPLVNGPVEFSAGPFGATVKTKYTNAPTKFCKPGELLICVRGSTTGRTNIAAFDACIGRGVASINAREHQPFVNLVVWSLRDYIFSLGTGSTFPSVSYDDLASLTFPLPSLAEQKRIVAKVDELMALCDELEAQQREREERKGKLVQASLARFAAAPTPDNLQFLFHKSYDIPPADLRKMILTLAVQGKLVRQEAGDEPAKELVARVAAEKRRLVQAKEIKAEPLSDPISEGEVFSIPENWTWCRAGDLCRPISSGSTPDQSVFHPSEGIPYLKVYNIRNQTVDFDYKPQFIAVSHHNDKMKRSKLCPGDVIMNIVGPPLGKVAIVPDTFPEWNCNQAISFFRPIFPDFAPYLYTFLKEGSFLDNIQLIGTAGQDNISVTKCKFIPVPMPPLAEQRRIVAKVTELMALVDELERQLEESRATGAKLLEAIVRELTGTT